MNYDKNKLIDNIYAIAKKKNINIKDLETKANVSVGYFSRMLKDKENLKASPTVSTMLSVSEDLGVSIELLSTCDFEKEELPSIRIISFLDKAIQKTLTGELKWVSEARDDYDKGPEQVAPSDPMPKSKSPLFAYEVVSNINGTKLRCKFHSKFSPEWCEPEGLMYYFEMNGNRYYILSITTSDERDYVRSHYEMYVVKGNTALPLCSSVIGNKSIVSQKLDELYAVIRKANAENPSNDEIFDEIDDFFKAMSEKESK